MILHSSDYNLRFICPNILKYENRYIDYINNTHTFQLDNNIAKSYFKIENETLKISSFSSYLIFSILFNFLQNKIAIKKDIENYYNSEMLNFLKLNRSISRFELKSLALSWSSISKSIDLLLSKTKDHVSLKTNYKIHWSDTEFNYSETIPLLGINKDDTLDIYLILQTSFQKYPLYSNDIDYLRIPSNVRIINYFIQQDIKINSLRILWLDNTDINQKLKYSEYNGISKDKILSYIKNNSDIINFKNNYILKYNNLNQCYSCPYFLSCSSSNSLLDNKRNSFKKQNKNSNYEINL